MVGISAYITDHNTREKQKDTQTVFRRYQSIESCTELLSLIKDMETGQRGYVITGDSNFLEPFSEARGAIIAATDSLRSLLDDTEHRLNLKDRIFVALDKKTTELENIVSIANTFGQDSAISRVETGTGRAYMDTLRDVINDVIEGERTLLATQNRELEENTRVEDAVRFFAFALIGLTSTLSLIALFRKQTRITRLFEELERANDELERKVTERTKQLVEANRAKDHFLGIASHDLKAPISGVLGLIELIRLEGGERPERENEYLNYMQDSCNNMQRLIANLLDINRIETGATILRSQEVNLRNLLSSIRTNFSHQARKKYIDFSVAEIDAIIDTDPDALTRVLENLVSNAIKFSPPNRPVHLKAERSNGQIKFSITDHGPGIPPEEIPKLFNKFQKLTNRPTGGEGSTGLGLSIARELTLLLGGEIDVQSTMGQGTTFTVTLPNGIPQAAL